MRWKRIFAVLVFVVVGTTTRDARATVCNFGTIVPCNFGTYDPSSGSPDVVTGSFQVTCSSAPGGGESGSVKITAGSNTVAVREFTGANWLYNAYTTSGYTTVFGEVFTSFMNTTATFNVYCRMPAGQAMPNASYTDSTQISISHFNPITLKSANFFPLATVAKYCSASVSGNLSFGTYSNVLVDNQATVSVNCTNTTTYTVMMGQGTNPAGGSSDTTPLRQMASGANRLAYFMYKTSGYTTVLGNTVGTGIAGTGSGSAQTVTMYGRIPAGGGTATGSYTDTTIISVTY